MIPDFLVQPFRRIFKLSTQLLIDGRVGTIVHHLTMAIIVELLRSNSMLMELFSMNRKMLQTHSLDVLRTVSFKQFPNCNAVE